MQGGKSVTTFFDPILRGQRIDVPISAIGWPQH